jgi:hypothetical protein
LLPSSCCLRSFAEIRGRNFGIEVEGQAASLYMIADQNHPEAGWRLDGVYPFESQIFDYALISRVFDSSTRNVYVSVSGLTIGRQQHDAGALHQTSRERARSGPLLKGLALFGIQEDGAGNTHASEPLYCTDGSKHISVTSSGSLH